MSAGSGSIGATVDGLAITTGDLITAGKTVIFTATPGTGYQVSNWNLNDATVNGNLTNTLTVSNIAEAIAVIVQFETIPTTDYSVLNGAISTAMTLEHTVMVSVDGTDVLPADKWVTASVMSAYSTAEGTATAVAEDSTATQTEVDNAVSALNSATSTFTEAEQVGTEATSIPVTSITLTGAGNATTVVSGGTLAKSASVLPADASDPSLTWSWTTLSGGGTVNIGYPSGVVLTGGQAGTVTVIATANDGSGVTGTEVITVNAATHYGIWVGGIEVTSGNAANVSGTGITGTVTYDAVNNMLTLNNAAITGYYTNSYSTGAGI